MLPSRSAVSVTFDPAWVRRTVSSSPGSSRSGGDAGDDAVVVNLEGDGVATMEVDYHAPGSSVASGAVSGRSDEDTVLRSRLHEAHAAGEVSDRVAVAAMLAGLSLDDDDDDDKPPPPPAGRRR